MTKPVITTRATKGSALSWTEGDTNLENLRDATISLVAGSGGTTVTSDLNGTVTLVAGTNISLSGDNTTKTLTINNTQSAGATNLDGLSDVVITSAATNDALIYNGTNWVDTALSGVTVGNVSGTVAIANGGTGKTTAPAAMAALIGYTTTATAGGTTTLSNTATYYQVFTGTSAQTVNLPSTSTLATGWSYHIVNNSTQALSITTSTSNSLGSLPSGVTMMATCITTASNAASAWETGYTDFSGITGTGNAVLATGPTLSSPTFTSPALGTPVSGTVTNLTGTASININGTVGATTANTGAFTTLTSSTSLNTDGTFTAKYLGTATTTITSSGGIGSITTNGSLTFKDTREAIYDLGTTGGTVAPNVANGSVQKITLNSALTLNAFTSPVAGQSLTLIIYGGTSYTSITSTMKFASGVKTLTGTAGCIDILSVYYDGTNYFASLGKGFA